MPKPNTSSRTRNPRSANTNIKNFKIEWKNANQKLAWITLQKHDLVFLLGPAGTAKTFLATAFAIREIVERRCKKIILTRPIVEAGGESLGYLPGTKEEKVYPYMLPFYDIIDQITDNNQTDKLMIMDRIRVSPLAYLRGCTFSDSICILDEAQNATKEQIKLFLTRFGMNSRMIITADPTQSDLKGKVAIMDVVKRLETVPNIGIIQFSPKDIVRHPLVSAILEKWED